MATKNIAGDSAFITPVTAGFPIHLVAISSAPKNRNNAPVSPMAPNNINATLNISCASLFFPNAIRSETSFAIALGTPIDANAKSNVYI